MSHLSRGATIALAILTVALVSCGEPSARPSPRSAGGPAVAVAEGWLAVVAVAKDPDELDALTRELMPIGGSAFVVSPASCFVGLPEDVTGYVLGFLAAERAEVDRLVERSDRPAAFVTQVRSRCTD